MRARITGLVLLGGLCLFFNSATALGTESRTQCAWRSMTDSTDDAAPENLYLNLQSFSVPVTSTSDQNFMRLKTRPGVRPQQTAPHTAMINGTNHPLAELLSDGDNNAQTHRSTDGKTVVKRYGAKPNQSIERAKLLYYREKLLTEFYGLNKIPVVPIIASDDSSLTLVKPFVAGMPANNQELSGLSEATRRQVQEQTDRITAQAHRLHSNGNWQRFLQAHGILGGSLLEIDPRSRKPG